MSKLGLAAVLALILGFCAAGAKAQEVNVEFNDWTLSGNDLLHACSVFVRVMDSNAPRSVPPGDGYEFGLCQGYVGGIATAISARGYLNFSSDPPTLEQLVRVVLKYLNGHPEKLNEIGFVLVNNALMAAFPDSGLAHRQGAAK